MTENQYNTKGLTNEQVLQARVKYGENKLNYKKENTIVDAAKRLFTDPMMVLLFVASSIYFISGKIGDGIFLTCAIIFQASISFFQFKRSKNALEKLNDLSQPNCKVIRNGKIEELKSELLVVGDAIIVEEGTSIMADGIIIQSNDFTVNESIITGESFAVNKDISNDNNLLFSGTTVTSGLAIATVTAIGNQTKLGKIGKSLESIKEEKTPLEIQITNFVKKMAFIGVIIFILVWILNYWHTHNIQTSLLQALTLAMSILPEEIPVAFSTFMALGAWRLMKRGIVVKQMKTVETLGSATVICTDKTGTITENKMSLAKLYILQNNQLFDPKDELNEDEKELLKLAMLASEPIPFDPMELALHQSYEFHHQKNERPKYKLIQEYPLEGQPPMMTHVFESKNGERIIAAKGAPEAFMSISTLSKKEQIQIKEVIQQLASQGYRLLAVGQSQFEGPNFPTKQQDLTFEFKGIVAFYDPPKKNIQKVLASFYNAGITVKIITGDNELTTEAIAKQIGFLGCEKSISGEELMKMNQKEIKKCVMDTNIFTRMFPEAKLKIIEALKSNHQIVAMTGDGVNDGPALKAAHIGVAMGKKGSEIAKQAASLILLDDDLSKMVVSVAMGRKIYSNLKKAIQYIISIHLPIILTIFIPLAFNWVYPTIFSPIHIIFLELIMGPTCSIIYENEPMEKNTMSQKPKPFKTTFFNWREIFISLFQGIFITIGTLTFYQYSIQNNYNEALTRTMIFTVLITANIFLTLVNRSFYYSIFTTLKYKNKMVFSIILTTLSLVGLILYIQPITTFFEFETLDLFQLFLSVTVGFLSVIWFEFVKFMKRKKLK